MKLSNMIMSVGVGVFLGSVALAQQPFAGSWGRFFIPLFGLVVGALFASVGWQYWKAGR